LNKLLETHKRLCSQAYDMLQKKNYDYADSEDPFFNFRLCQHLKLCSAAAGVLIRITDKLSRLANAESKDLHCESYEDSIIDAINYLVILAEMRKEKE
jgi:hypothetical protein